MKKLLATIGCLLTFSALWAQTEKQTDTTANYDALISVDRVKLLSNMDVIANMQFGMNNYFTDGKYTNSKFAMNQFRFEMKGKVGDKVYYRFRNRYTRAQDPQSQDNLSRAVDLAFLRIDVSKKISLQFGKMCADWGGYEFDLNPIDIYEYNDIVEYADNFLTGVQASWKATPKHEFTFQLLNSRTKTYEELYGTIPGVEESKFPAAIVTNWRGSFAEGKFTTLWSYSAFLEAKGKVMNYWAFGNQLNLKKGTITYDFKFSDEDIDRKTIVTSIVPDSYNPYAALDVRYVEHWLQLQYRFAPKWNAALIGMVSDAYWFGNPDPKKDDHLRTSFGFIPTIEFYPFKQMNLRFYATYVARSYNYSDYSEQKFGSKDYNTGRFQLGFISPLLIL